MSQHEVQSSGCLLTRDPTLHGSKVCGRLRLARVEDLNRTAAEHGNGQTGRASNGLLTSGDDTIQTPGVEGNLFGGDRADTIANDQSIGRDALDRLGEFLEREQDSGRGIDMRGSNELILLLLERLLDVGSGGNAADWAGELGDFGAVG